VDIADGLGLRAPVHKRCTATEACLP